MIPWYTQLKPRSIHTWDDFQSAFLAQFVSSKREVSIIDLCDAQQKPNESVYEFITRWRSLNLQCFEKLTSNLGYKCAQITSYQGLRLF